jgi:hypothetical protein
MLSFLKGFYVALDYRRTRVLLNHILRLGHKKNKDSIVLMIYRLEPRSGGLRNVARIANALSKYMNKNLLIYIQNQTKKDGPLLAEYGFSGKIVISLPSEATLFVTTSFIFSLSFPDALKKISGRWFHIIQDYDELFFPVSTRSYHASKVRFGPEAFIASGKWMKLSEKSAYLPFPVDSDLYYSSLPESEMRDIDVLFFHKPELPRRCAFLCEQIASILLEKRPDLQIAFYGSPLSKWLTRTKVKHFGSLSTLAELGKTYRRSKIGVSFNLTNPSLIPFEQMACGCLPVSPCNDLPEEFHLPEVHVEGSLNELCDYILAILDGPSVKDMALDLYQKYYSNGYICKKDEFDSEIFKAISAL